MGFCGNANLPAVKSLYLLLAVVGFAVPTALVVRESLATGNWLLWADPAATSAGMFANRIATIFSLDLLLATAAFLAFAFAESRRLRMPRPWAIAALTLAFGLSGALPLFLYLRERRLAPARRGEG